MKKNQSIISRKSILLVILVILGFIGPLSLQNLNIHYEGGVADNKLNDNIRKAPLASVRLQKEPFITTINQNPGFEDINPDGSPRGNYRYQGSTYRFQNFTDSRQSFSGTKSVSIQARGSNSSWAYSRISKYYSGINPDLANQLDLDLRYYISNPPRLDLQGIFYIQLYLSNGATNRYISYYLSYGISTQTNNSVSVYYFLNSSIGSWHHLVRDIDQDFNTAFGSSSGYYITELVVMLVSPSTSLEICEVFLDDFFLNSSTDENYIGNSYFETPNSWWSDSRSSSGEIKTTDFCTEGTRALNLSLTNEFSVPTPDSYSYFGVYYGYPTGRIIRKPADLVIDFDWFYTQTSGNSVSQRAYIYITIQNPSLGNRNIQYYLGTGDTNSFNSNSSYYTFYYLNNFGIENQWVHESIDLWDLVEHLNQDFFVVQNIDFYIYLGDQVNSSLELLVDDFNIRGETLSDPGFEETWYSDEFAAWLGDSNSAYINSTSDVHSGVSAADMGVYGGIHSLSLNPNNVFLDVESSTSTDFWYKLEKITGGNTYGYFQLLFEGGFYLCYVFAASSTGLFSNGSQSCYYLLENINQTNQWLNLKRNLASDLNSSFGLKDWNLTSISIILYASGSDQIRAIFDDIQFTETTPPILHEQKLTGIPVYYQNTEIQINCSDEISEILSVQIYYRTGIDWNIVNASENSGIFYGEIPTFSYGTLIEYYLNISDDQLNYLIDDNGGVYYSFTIGDDIPPEIGIINPYNNTILSDTVKIRLSAEDLGSDIGQVEIFANDTSIGIIYSEPYEYNWDTRTFLNGMYILSAEAQDVAGNRKSTDLNITLFLENDNSAPFISNVIINPENPEVNQPVAIYASIIDDSNIKNATLFYKIVGSSSNWTSISMSEQGFLFLANIPGMSWNSTVLFYLEAVDDFNQVGYYMSALSPESYFVDDYTAPSLEVVGPIVNSTLSGSPVSFFLIGRDSGSGISHYEIEINGSIETIDENPGTYTWNILDFENGNYTISFIAVDRAGNSYCLNYTYEIENVQGFFPQIWNWVDNILQSYYGMAVGAGGVVMLGIIYAIVKKNISKKKSGG